jgi:predicted enzyme related to lactoylglutathione lyase
MGMGDGITTPAPGGISIGQNFQSVEDMRAGLAQFIKAGGTMLREPFDAPWGLIAYAADIDGHAWEFAHVPGFEPNDAGQFILPSERNA